MILLLLFVRNGAKTENFKISLQSSCIQKKLWWLSVLLFLLEIVHL
jgi:hypothetical protein